MQYKNVEFDWPLDVNIIRKGNVVNTFGMVRRKANGDPKPHQGWDLFAPEGTPCYAVADATVVTVNTKPSDYGNTVVLFIPEVKLYAAYCHLSDIFVKKGDSVRLGQPIAKTGISGNAAGMKGEDQHLHFEFRELFIVGLGLEGRISPLKVFRNCPLALPITREKLTKNLTR